MIEWRESALGCEDKAGFEVRFKVNAECGQIDLGDGQMVSVDVFIQVMAEAGWKAECHDPDKGVIEFVCWMKYAPAILYQYGLIK